MTASRTKQLQSLFDLTIQTPRAKRREQLESLCAGDSELQQDVESLLRAYDEAGDFLSAPESHCDHNSEFLDFSPDASIPKGSAGELDVGTRIGDYEILKKLGEGGFAIVYHAEQHRPVRRHVALKVLKSGMDTSQVLARFAAESQALALMDHPHIAKVYDVGTLASGRPFFVMERVDGQPITQFCDEHRLGIRERLELFGHVCRAVQHAHQKGIIHRDLKPSNILVGGSHVEEDRPVPKVIDFGIAKALHQRLSDRTLVTEASCLVGTPDYMSPEQAEWGGVDIDTRSDIYSLGALLYELLTGCRPYAIQELRGKSWEEIWRWVRQHDAPLPSVRLRSMSESERQQAAHLRRTDPRKLAKLLTGELDSITMKCLEKEKPRRYETANGLAEDIQRHLHGEPVQARPSTALYRAAKFARRNKVGVAAAASVVAALLLGVVGTSIGMARARLAQARAEREAQAATTANRFMRESLGVEERELYGLGRFERPTDLLYREIDDLTLKEQVSAEEEMEARYRVGRSLMAVEWYRDAIGNLKRAAELAAQLRGEADPLTLGIQSRLVQSLLELELREAEVVARAAYDAAQRNLGSDHPDTVLAQSNLADSLHYFNPAAAEPLYRDLLQRAQRDVAASPGQVMALTTSLSWVLYCMGKLDEAERYGREAATRLNAPGAGEVLAAVSVEANFILAQILMTAGQLTEAREMYERIMDDERARCRTRHGFYKLLSGQLAELLVRSDDIPAALALQREVLQLATEEAGGKDALQVALARGAVAELLARQGDLQAAQEQLQQATDMLQRVVPTDTLVQDWKKCHSVVSGLGTPTQWTNEALYWQLCAALDGLFGPHGSHADSLETIRWADLRFELLDSQHATKHTGGLAELRSVPELAPGNYSFSLELPGSEPEPLRAQFWLLFSDWRLTLYGLPHAGYQLPPTWQEVVRRPPLARGSSTFLAFLSNPLQSSWTHPATTTIGLVAETRIELPAGRYRLRVRSDDGVRLFLDGQCLIESWKERSSATDEAFVELDEKLHELRVEYFQARGSSLVWMSMEPVER